MCCGQPGFRLTFASTMAIADLRREYSLSGLRRADLDPNPVTQFRNWFEHAASQRRGGRVRKFFISLYKAVLMLAGTPPPDVNAMTLATVDSEGRPSARVVLLKGVDERGFIFFTNYLGRKARELEQHPDAALVFYWVDLERQVCVSGSVTKLPEAESESYFRSRPRGSRIGAWASKQSSVVPNRESLEQSWAKYEMEFPGDDVPKPPNWGGYVLQPRRIEFWQGRPSRLHDRFEYLRQPDNTWTIQRLAP